MLIARQMERGFALEERVERELPAIAGFFAADSAMRAALSEMVEGARKVDALLRTANERRRFQLLELKLHLVEQARSALRALAVELSPQLLDAELQMRDQRLVPGPLGPRLRVSRPLGHKRRLQGVQVVRQGLCDRIHGPHGITVQVI